MPAVHPDTTPLLTVQEAAEMVGCWPCHLWGVIRAGHLPAQPADPRGRDPETGTIDVRRAGVRLRLPDVQDWIRTGHPGLEKTTYANETVQAIMIGRAWKARQAAEKAEAEQVTRERAEREAAALAAAEGADAMIAAVRAKYPLPAPKLTPPPATPAPGWDKSEAHLANIRLAAGGRW